MKRPSRLDHFKAGNVFVGIVGIPDRCSIWVSFRLTCKCQAMLERLVRYKSYSSFSLFVSDGEDSLTLCVHLSNFFPLTLMKMPNKLEHLCLASFSMLVLYLLAEWESLIGVPLG
jgi:hypothetical protein